MSKHTVRSVTLKWTWRPQEQRLWSHQTRELRKKNQMEKLTSWVVCDCVTGRQKVLWSPVSCCFLPHYRITVFVLSYTWRSVRKLLTLMYFQIRIFDLVPSVLNVLHIRRFIFGGFSFKTMTCSWFGFVASWSISYKTDCGNVKLLLVWCESIAQTFCHIHMYNICSLCCLSSSVCFLASWTRWRTLKGASLCLFLALRPLKRTSSPSRSTTSTVNTLTVGAPAVPSVSSRLTWRSGTMLNSSRLG